MRDHDLLRAFEDCSLPYAEWTHRCHVKIAYLYLRRFPFDEALAKVRSGIQKYNATNSVVEGPTTGYSETTTQAFLRLIAATIDTCQSIPPTSTADAFCDAHPQLMTSHALRFFYSPTRRADPRAKRHFVEPDLAPLPTLHGSQNVGDTLLRSAIATFQADKGWADKAIAQLDDDKLHTALDPNTNSIAVIMKHVAGNLLSRWTDFLTSDGEKPWRNRDDEFIDSFTTRQELLAYWESGWNRLFETLESLRPADLLKSVTIRGEPHSVPLAIQRSLAHCGYHVGQIVLIARILAGDQWQTISIPRGASQSYNEIVWGKGHYQRPAQVRQPTENSS
ncbi:MAG TPA: DUF1572 family protein [Pirellulales bacterium]|nr:DUF1572 family protein [Pirellulales bacterium]